MQSKLEELARKEEELRKINEALDIKKNAFMAVDESANNEFNDYEEDKSSENSDDQFKGKNLAGAGKHVAARNTDFQQEDEDDYSDGQFENPSVNNTGKSDKKKASSLIDTRGGSKNGDSFKDKF